MSHPIPSDPESPLDHPTENGNEMKEKSIGDPEQETIAVIKTNTDPHTALKEVALPLHNEQQVSRKTKDERTEDDLAKGTPFIHNRGLLDVDLDTATLQELMQSEGLNPSQMNDLEVIFRDAEFVDTNLHGRFIGGVTKGACIEIFTTLPLIVSDTENVPSVREHFFTRYYGAITQEQVVDSFLHELRHYMQACKGQKIDNTMLASDEQYDTSESEQDAIAFAKAKAPMFHDKLKTYDDRDGLFQKGTQFPFLTNRFITTGNEVNLDKVAKILIDSEDEDKAYRFVQRYRNLIQKQAITPEEARSIEEQGAALVQNRIISSYEYAVITQEISQRLTGTDESILPTEATQGQV